MLTRCLFACSSHKHSVLVNTKFQQGGTIQSNGMLRMKCPTTTGRQAGCKLNISMATVAQPVEAVR